MKTYVLFLYPPKTLNICKWKTGKANSMEEFMEMCYNDIFTKQLLNTGWTVATVREVK